MAIPAYAESLSRPSMRNDPEPDVHLVGGDREQLAAFWLTLDAINFGSGWFPTLRKPPGRSGYSTIADGLRRRFSSSGPWSADQLRTIDPPAIATVLGQEPEHELMELYARSLRDLGQHVAQASGFVATVQQAGSSAVGLVEQLAGWDCFADCSRYGGIEVPFLKRAQIAAADLHRAGVIDFPDLNRLTMFADNLVPHVLRVDGVLRYSAALLARIERGELIPHGSPEEVEIRACAVQAVALLVAALPGSSAAQIDEQLWLRGQGERYKSVRRHRSRSTAY